MIELGLHPAVAALWFVTNPQQAFTRVSVSAEVTATWGYVLRDAVRRAYISDQALQASQHTRAAVLGAKLPNAVATLLLVLVPAMIVSSWRALSMWQRVAVSCLGVAALLIRSKLRLGRKSRDT